MSQEKDDSRISTFIHVLLQIPRGIYFEKVTLIHVYLLIEQT